MNDFFPTFNFIDTFWAPWESVQDFSWNGKIVAMGFLVSLACGLIGAFIVVRKLALMGDAISHGILPGLALAFIITQSKDLIPMFVGACIAGLLCSFCIEWLQKVSPLKADAALGLTFTSFFALGVLLITQMGNHAHIDSECLLYGEIGFTPLAETINWGSFELGPRPLVTMALVTIGIILTIVVFYRQLIVTSFDETLSISLGLPIKVIHYGLMLLLAITIVAAFESVGVILVIAMLIFPSTTASFFFSRMPSILFCVPALSLVYSLGGFFMARWLDCSIAASMVVIAMVCFAIAWLIGPVDGVIPKILQRKAFAYRVPS
jgi:manganese/zinc/iron transport system permease protein